MNELRDNHTILIEYQCFGNILFWAAVAKNHSVCFERFERFQKTGFRNRYQVLGSNGTITLTIPVVGGRESKALTREVIIDNSSLWQARHWKALQSCYNKSPFFSYYEPGLKPLYSSAFEKLMDFDLAAFNWVVKILKLNVEVMQTEYYSKEHENNNFIDWRGMLTTGNRENAFQKPYYQVFSREFQQNLCILDLIFNLGPEARSYLENGFAN